MRCARHPNVETDLSCGRCETPICPRCMVHAEVGIRCQTCRPPPKFWERRRFQAGGGTFFIVALIVAVVVAWQLGTDSGGSPQGFSEPPPGFDPSQLQPVTIPLRQDTAPEPSGGYRLAISATACAGIQAAAVTVCEGAVENISDAPIEDVTVIVEFLLADGEPAVIDRNPLAVNPLLPGQQAGWAIEASANAEFKEYRLVFRSGTEAVPARPPQ